MADIDETWTGDAALALMAHLLKRMEDPKSARLIKRIIFSVSKKDIQLYVKAGEKVLDPEKNWDDEPIEQLPEELPQTPVELLQLDDIPRDVMGNPIHD